MATTMKDYNCTRTSRCSFKTTLNCQMKSHLERHDLPKEQKVFNCANAIKSLKCFQCTNFETHNLAHLKNHFKANHTLLKFETELHQCENCSFQTYSNYLFLRHKLFKLCKEYGRIKPPHLVMEHIDPKKIQLFQCEKCSYKSIIKTDLANHLISMHSDKKRFQCDQCPYVTTFKTNWRQHILRKHSEDRSDKIKRFQCDQCLFKTARENYLKIHVLRKHSEDKPEKIKRFQCDQCSFETAYKNNLKRHVLKTHSEKKPERVKRFQCDQCPFKTAFKENLKRHVLKTHSEEGPERVKRFQCDQCLYKTVHKNYLRRHVLRKHPMHRPEKIKCLEYAQSSHKTDVTSTKNSEPEKIQWFQCELCPYKYTVEAYLKRHMECTHGKGQVYLEFRKYFRYCPLKSHK